MAKRRERRSFSDKFKRDLIAQIEDGTARVTDLAKKHKIQASQISMWKSKYGSGSSKASGGKKRGRPAGSTNRTAAAPAAAKGNNNARIAELERMIGQLTIENARLKGEL